MNTKNPSLLQIKKYEDVHFVDSAQAVWNYSLFTDEDIQHFQQGVHYTLYKKLGAHHITVLNTAGIYFSVWAPNATYVSVISNFNNWNTLSHPLRVRQDNSGIWEGFIPNMPLGEIYKYHIHGYNGIQLNKGDPFAYYWEKRPKTGSITWNLNYTWKDAAWMHNRHQYNSLQSPISIYEMHLGSWMRPEKDNEESYNSYEQITKLLIPYIKDLGFTHVEFMPIMEHPFDGSWGYQGTGYFAPTSRFGNPQDFMALIDALHKANIGVILDWVPSHFPNDAHGLFMFDGTHTYEYADMRKGYQPDWESYVFNYERNEVRSFLLSSAHYWLNIYHVDGLRVDAVSSMLKLNYSKRSENWEPNKFGGDGNLEAVQFLKQLNELVYREFPNVQTIAEEATDWPQVSRPTYTNGLGFGMKWMMGWMHDTLNYFKKDPIYRASQQDQFTFSMMYYYNENFVLPLSHDEIVHGKSPMIYKMPGDEWQKFANLRLLYTYMFTHPGAKLLFMGNEFGSTNEWNYQSELPWKLLQFDCHRKLKDCVATLNRLYTTEPALYEKQFDIHGFEWIDLNHREESVIVYRRKGKIPANDVLIILNMTPIVRHNWAVYVYGKNDWKEIFNSDAKQFWGTGDVYNPNITSVLLDKTTAQYKITVHLPALGGIILK